jgi:hypothetical protein
MRGAGEVAFAKQLARFDRGRRFDQRSTYDSTNWTELVAQLLDVREELLLFLKHVEELVVGEISAEGGEPHELLSVRTTNEGEVRAAREGVLKVLRGDTAAPPP